MGELRKEQRRAMAPRAESAAERLGACLPRQPGHEMIGDEIANLPQHAQLAADWRGGVVLFFHTGFIAEKSAPRQSTSSLRYGMAVKKLLHERRA